MAFARPPSFTVRGLHVRREDFKGQPVYAITSDVPSGHYVVALHGGDGVVGLSMGASAALVLGIYHPQQFAYAAARSGC